MRQSTTVQQLDWRLRRRLLRERQKHYVFKLHMPCTRWSGLSKKTWLDKWSTSTQHKQSRCLRSDSAKEPPAVAFWLLRIPQTSCVDVWRKHMVGIGRVVWRCRYAWNNWILDVNILWRSRGLPNHGRLGLRRSRCPSFIQKIVRVKVGNKSANVITKNASPTAGI